MFARPEPVAVRVGWPDEARHFTPWLAEHLDWMEIPELGPLSTIEVEISLPGTGRALDILAETSDGQKVAIENQYSRVDHDHLTRGLAYAVGLQARALVVVAEAHGQEFTAVADYLNRCAEAIGQEQAIAIFLVGLSLERVGDLHVPRFEVLTRPNSWRSSTAAQGRGAGFASLDEFRARVDTAALPHVDAIFERWGHVSGATILHKAKNSVALAVANPTKTSGRTVLFGVDTTGGVWFDRGYVLDSAPFTDQGATELDAIVASTVGVVTYTGKGYYCTVAEPRPDSLAELGRWIAERFQRAGADSVAE